MKKILIIGLFLIFTGLIFAQVTGTVSEVDKYGNVHANILQEQMDLEGLETGDILEVSFNGTVLEIPYVTTYGDVDSGSVLLRLSGGHVLIAINYGNCSKTYGLETGIQISISLFDKGAYKEELEIRHLVRTDERNDYAGDEIFANFREVVLGAIGTDILFRTSHPSMDDPRSPYAGKLMEEAGIKTVVNLSDSAEEFEANLSFNEYYKKLNDEGNVIALNMGVDLLSVEFAQKLQTGLLFMIEKEPPFLVHCVEGKDRAGMIVAILGAIMDAGTEEIYKDYVVSYENYYNVKPNTLAYTAVEKIIKDIFQSLNGENPVNDSNVKEIAVRYLKKSRSF